MLTNKGVVVMVKSQLVHKKPSFTEKSLVEATDTIISDLESMRLNKKQWNKLNERKLKERFNLLLKSGREGELDKLKAYFKANKQYNHASMRYPFQFVFQYANSQDLLKKTILVTPKKILRDGLAIHEALNANLPLEVIKTIINKTGNEILNDKQTSILYRQYTIERTPYQLARILSKEEIADYLLKLEKDMDHIREVEVFKLSPDANAPLSSSKDSAVHHSPKYTKRDDFYNLLNDVGYLTRSQKTEIKHKVLQVPKKRIVGFDLS